MSSRNGVNISSRVFDEAAEIAESIYMSRTRFFEECALQMIKMHKTLPENRTVPPIVALMDAAATPRQHLHHAKSALKKAS